MIDIRSHKTFTPESWRAIEDAVLAAGPPYVVLADRSILNEIALEGFGGGPLYVRYTEIQVILDPEVEIVPKEVDLAAAKAFVKEAIGNSIQTYVEAYLPEKTQSHLAVLLQKTTLRRMMGAPVQEWALVSLLATLAWGESAMALTKALCDQVDAAQTLTELRRVVVEPAVLGEPPAVSVPELAAALA